MAILDSSFKETEDIVAPAPAPATEPVAVQGETAEERSALALGLPTSWSIEPPAIVVRRKVRIL